MKARKHHEAVIEGVLSAQGAGGRLRSRESTTIEFKENFGFLSLPDYARTMAGFTNHQGGYLIFGVTNAPRQAQGISREHFDRIDLAKLTTGLNELFDPAMQWELGHVEFNGMYFGFIYTAKHPQRPVICKKTMSRELREGEIYYRYHAQTRVIGFAELRAILDETRVNEQKLWMQHIENIARIGPSNLAFLDLARGDISGLSASPQFVVERSLLNEMRKRFVLVEEGHFTESEGPPHFAWRAASSRRTPSFPPLWIQRKTTPSC